MRNAITIAIIFLVAACGDNIRPESPDLPNGGPVVDDPTINPGEGCADFDVNVACPDASVDSPPDAAPDLDDETKAACCHALLDGTPPNHECGYPPGLCNNGKKTMFCKTAEGADAQFELCNP